MSCSSCGAALTLDTRQRREVCSTCSRPPAVCPCRPAPSEWVRRMQQHRGVAKVWSSAA